MAVDLNDPAALVQPVSDDAPCGPDLDLAGDPDFLRATGRIEGMLPSSFFSQDDEGRLQPFDRSKIEIAPALKEIAGLLEQTRDLRLLTLSSRLCALNRDLAGVSAQFRGIAGLLKERWADVHPQPEDGDYGLRMAILSTLDDPPTMALPLQFMTLAESRRVGPITFRAMMMANGEIAAAEGETPLDRSAVDRAFAEADLEALKTTYGRVAGIRDAIATIRLSTIEGAGYENAVSFDRVSGLVDKMAAALEGVLSARDPSSGIAAPTAVAGADQEEAVEASPRGGASKPAGPIRNIKQAAAALGAAGAYLRAFEPSSPAELLVRQALGLVGKSFIDVMRILVPNHADEAKIAIGADRALELSFGQLSSVADEVSSSGDDGWSSSSDDGWSDGPGDAEEPAANGEAAPAEPPAPKAETRREALDILRQVSLFYRSAEPSSPIPLLLDRACALAETDFLTILKDVLPQLMRRDADE